jgi:hypothetical protein
MEEFARHVRVFQSTGSSDSRIWLEQWTCSPAVWAALPAMLSSPSVPAHLVPYIAAAARRSCEASNTPGSTMSNWASQLAVSLLRHPMLQDAAAQCHPATALAFANSTKSVSLALALWNCSNRTPDITQQLIGLTSVLLDSVSASASSKVWARLCEVSGGPRTPAQWEVCFGLGFVECLCEGADRVDPDRLAQELGNNPQFLAVASLVKRTSFGLLRSVSQLAAVPEFHTPAVRALLHLFTLELEESHSFLPLLRPVFAVLRSQSPVISLWQSMQEEPDADDEDDDVIVESVPYELALRKLLNKQKMVLSKYDLACKRLAKGWFGS